MDELISKSQALRLLEVMEESASGTLKGALFSLRQWVQAQHESSPETLAELKKIFAGDEADRPEPEGFPPDNQPGRTPGPLCLSGPRE